MATNCCSGSIRLSVSFEIGLDRSVTEREPQAEQRRRRMNRGQGRRPVGNRPANEHSVFSPRRAIIIVDLAATRAIVPVPITACVLWRTFELLLRKGGAVPPQAGVIREGLPGERIVVAADAQEAAKAEHSIRHLAAALVDHDALDGSNMLAFGVIDIRAFHFIAPDETSSLSRFCCHWIAPHYCPVTALRRIHRTGRPCPR